MSEDGSHSTGPVDSELLDRIATHLARSARFEEVQTRPAYAPNAVVADYDLGYFPGGVARASLRIRWFETDDFSIHYSEQYQTGEAWECRWDRHPNNHNTREHFHPPPDAPTPGRDTDYQDEWRDVLATVLTRLDERILLSLVGSQETIRSVLRNFEEAGVVPDLHRLGEYEGGAGTLEALTDRQLEVLQTAYDMGFYEVPREASVDDVADEVGLDGGTVSEHLQRAERNILTQQLTA